MEDFDLISQVHERIFSYLNSHDHPPAALLLSPAAFHWLREIYVEEYRILGSSPLSEKDWTLRVNETRIAIRIDEMLDDYDVRLI
ncbi:MAG: hypothetical protein JXA28_05700 [Bacteroidetes bacterium]|nr:hypothetical protein [Bacteroidota bacterium]